MEKNVHYKMHKVKKRWVTISVASATMLASALGASVASADTDAAATDANNAANAAVAGDQAVSGQDNQAAPLPATATSEDAGSTEEVAVNQDAQVANTDGQEAQWVPSTDNNSEVSDAVTPQAAVAATDAQSVPQALTNLSNVKQVDGKYYYYDADGNVKKNFAVSVGDAIFYFDETGAYKDTSKVGADKTSSSANQTTATFAANNRAYSTAAENFEAIDNYLTADSWYRPKSILKDGKTWTESTKDDFRPLLMAWWPDTETKRNYVNYMNKVVGIDKTYTAETSQADLTAAAELVQARIEQRITSEKNTKWLREAISAFVKTQPQWNGESEKPYDDHLQNGALKFDNETALTPDTQSGYRILNRTPTNQTGSLDPRFTFNQNDPLGGYEYLLANDVDNSNPVVQAESLNWLHYLLNFGSIYANDPEANFDSIRVDAVDNVDADLLQISSDYLKSAYKIDKNNKNANDHVSIVEAWSDNDTPYLHDEGDNLMNMDNKFRLSMLWSLAKPLDKRSGLNPLIHNSVVDREVDDREVEKIPSYSFARAHDSEVQDLIRDIIKAEINPNSFGYSFTQEEIDQAFKIYNEDLKKTNKKYTHYNVPLSYTLLLTNKGSIPRIYYGDMFTDDGQYMANKTVNYNAIESLLKARMKYVSGGQAMQNYQIGNGEILTSVRYGKGALKQSDKGDATTRTSGIGVVMGNQPNFSLEGKVVALNMGAAHANQEYRALMVSTKDGVATYATDADASKAGMIKRTDENGYLYFLNDDLKGVANPQISGFLQVWVPVGAPADQDIRVAASDAASTDGKSLHQDAAMDSRVMFEGFSNFQAFATKEDEYTNVVIAKNVDKFVSWGITDFEMAPQYVSSTDGQFLDSVIQNGYAFTDRYDLGMSKANKYGTAEHLVKAIKALHKAGLKVMADWVPDQMYTFPKKEVVTVTRTDKFGKPIAGSQINHTLYVTDTKGSGDDYQAKYGGAFLDELKEKYPELFTKKQISTGQAIDPSVKIKQWSAKYFNGSNILGRGANYVLSDQASNKYFNVAEGKVFLPGAMLGKVVESGIRFDGKGYIYNSSTTGEQVKDSFITEAGNLYYFGKDGYMVMGAQNIQGANYYFLANGAALRNSIFTDQDGKSHYYANDGKRYENGYYQFGNDSWRYFENGVMAVGVTRVAGHDQYFDKDGIQAKNKIIVTRDGKVRYFDEHNGNAVTNAFISDQAGHWYYLGKDGVAVTGAQTVGKQHLYFEANGQQVKGDFVTAKDGKLYFFDADSGDMWTDTFVQDKTGHWFYLGKDGAAVTGAQTVRGQKLYFKANGQQVKGDIVKGADGKIRYYDANSGDQVYNRTVKGSDGKTYIIGKDGVAITQTIAKGQTIKDGSVLRFYSMEGQLVTGSGWYSNAQGQWLYVKNGQVLTGLQTVGSQRVYFDANGIQAKGKAVRTSDGKLRYFDANSGSMITNQWKEVNGQYYYFDNNGVAIYRGWN
ncbi:glycoside hydrolase family 70 protein [Streptococcus tangpeifui]|uniref:glycoside hydrolase family 70 protein n=1 Tax=Streptococcus tangpeifui TaxID=2709400 RepID=UPI0013EABD55|nr:MULTISPECIES: glycoside hydrolase family 70 protein [unclassified Streptococcus]